MKLVNAEEVRQIFDYEVAQGATDLLDAFDFAIENATAVESAPVVHGRWEHYRRGCYFNVKCTACGVDAISVNTTLPVSLPTVMWEHCPNCGADMRGEQE